MPDYGTTPHEDGSLLWYSFSNEPFCPGIWHSIFLSVCSFCWYLIDSIVERAFDFSKNCMVVFNVSCQYYSWLLACGDKKSDHYIYFKIELCVALQSLIIWFTFKDTKFWEFCRIFRERWSKIFYCQNFKIVWSYCFYYLLILEVLFTKYSINSKFLPILKILCPLKYIALQYICQNKKANIDEWIYGIFEYTKMNHVYQLANLSF